MDADLMQLCDAWDDKQITLKELYEQMILRRARLAEKYRKEKEQEAQGQG
ncbi:MAG: hypothetical protein Q8M54_00465 [Desulfobaccales bacterium]|nr:hypothetical protein [Desulfobaccales bacterium]